MDPLEAAKLRRMAKSKGLQAVVDDKGFVKVPLSDTAAEPVTRPAAARSSKDTTSITSSTAAAAAVEAGVADSGRAVPDEQQQQQQQQQQRRGDDSSSSNSRSRLFSKSQLQPAAVGSGGTAPALPIVRPNSSSSTQAGSSSRGMSSSNTPPWASKSRNSRGGGSSSSSGSAAFFSSKSWEDLHATPELIAALKAVGVTKPSHVQAEAFKALGPKSKVRHVALADQAGSGKTLAYLLPLLQQLKQKEAAAGGPVTKANSPSVIIMAPTTGELSLRCFGLLLWWCCTARASENAGMHMGRAGCRVKHSRRLRAVCRQTEQGWSGS
jgi:hypothetical protein